MGIALLLAAWAAGIWYYTVGRNTIFKPESAAPYVPPKLDSAPLPMAPPPAPQTVAANAAPVETAVPTQDSRDATYTLGIREAVADRAPLDACGKAMADAGIKLPPDFGVLAVSASRGRDLGYRVGRNGHLASQVDLIINSPGKPIALMLGAYDPIVWNVSWTSGTRIFAIHVGGYEPQQLVGPGGNAPHLIVSHEQGSPCPGFTLGGSDMSSVNPAARRVFGKPVDEVFPVGKDGSLFIGPGGPLGGFSYSRTPAPGEVPRNPLLAEAGLDFAVKMGQLRKATSADSTLWAQAMKQNGGNSTDLPPVAGQSGPSLMPPPTNAYIVLSREFIFPDGLYGAHAVIFVVPPGVPKPRGNPGHSAVYVVQ